MAVTIEVSCRYCHQIEPVRKHGSGKTGFPWYYCQDCRRTFQLNYRYNAYKPGVREQVVDYYLVILSVCAVSVLNAIHDYLFSANCSKDG